MTDIKAVLRTVLITSIRGEKDGLSRFGTLLEKLARYIVFFTRAARQEARFSAPYRGEILTARATLSPDAIVYDIGANNGDDTEYFLKKGLRVVAVEANPALATHVAHRFADDVMAGRLVVLNVAASL